MNHYDTYKPSGIDWIGDVPSHWEVGKIAYIGQFINGYAFKPAEWSTKGKPIIRIQDLTGSNTTEPNYYEGELPQKYKVEPGDILISWAATLDAFKWKGEEGWLNQHIFKAIPNEGVGRRFFYHIMSVAMYNMRHANRHGIMMEHVTYDVFKKFPLPLPPLSEQEAIAAYLDKRCGEIDKVISTQERRIELLREMKQSIITRAVTKGINPNVPMKDSGVERFGEVPLHWEIKRVKTCTIIANGKDPKTEGEIPVYGSGAASFKTCGEFKEGPCVLLGRKGATLHIPHFITGKYWNVDTAFDVKTTKEMDLRFFYYHSTFFDYALYTMTTTLPSMTQTDYGNMLIPVPPIEEQYMIIEHLEKKLERVDAAITKAQREVELLRELKQATITEVVTGKRKVC